MRMLQLAIVVRAISSSEEAWNAMARFADDVMTEKECERRQAEADGPPRHRCTRIQRHTLRLSQETFRYNKEKHRDGSKLYRERLEIGITLSSFYNLKGRIVCEMTSHPRILRYA